MQKAIAYIGSDPRNDVVLEGYRGGGISPRHVQVIVGPAGGQGYRLVNMSDANIALGASGERTIGSRSFADVASGDRIRLGEFTLVFFAGGGSPAAAAMGASTGAVGTGISRNSSVIGVVLNLPQTDLSPNLPLDGSVIVRNLGDKTGAQFKLEVEGLDPELCEIGPGPILFPGAEKDMFFRLHHPRKPKPPAGEYSFTVRVTAPAAYPGEGATASQVIRILPYFSHKLRVVTTD